MKTIKAIVFIRPNGAKKEIEVKNIYEDDAKFINENNIKVTMEKGSFGEMIVYFDYGAKIDGEPDELIQISFSNKSCKDTIQEGIKKVKTLIKQLLK